MSNKNYKDLFGELEMVKNLTISKIEKLQDFQVFTGHSYDRYKKMVVAGHLKENVTNIRTKTNISEKQLSSQLLEYLDKDLPIVITYQLIAHFEDFISSLRNTLRKKITAFPRRYLNNNETLFKYLKIRKVDIYRYLELDETRDVFAHKGGIADEKYIKRAKQFARARIKEPLPIGRPYTYDSADFLKLFIGKIISRVQTKLNNQTSG